MEIRFEHISAKNFMSFKELELDLTQFESQTVLISGRNEDIHSNEYQVMNGSGKTTLLNSILYSVYGETLKPLKSKDIAHWGCSAKENVELSLRLTSGGTSYALSRVLKGKARNGELHVHRKNGDEWEEITLSTMAETQRMIETEIVPCGKDGFLRCIILTADQQYNFFKLTKSAKDAFFESLFELTTYKEMYERLHRMTLDTSNAISADSRLIDSLNDSIVKLTAERDEMMAKSNDLNDAEKELSERTKELEEFKASHADEETIKSEYDTKMSAYKAEVGSRLKQQLSEFDSENHVISADAHGKVSVDERSFDDSKNALLAEFDAKHDVSKLSGELESVDSEISTVGGRIERGNSMLDEIKAKESETNIAIADTKNRIGILKERITSMSRTIDSSRKVTDMLCGECLPKYNSMMSLDECEKTIIECKTEIGKLTDAITELNSELTSLKANEDSYSTALVKLNAKLSELNGRRTEINDGINGIRSERKLIESRIDSERDMYVMGIQSRRNELRGKLRNEYDNGLNELKNQYNVDVFNYRSELAAYTNAVNIAKSKYDASVEARKNSYDAPIASLNGRLDDAKKTFDEKNSTISHYKALEEVLKPENLRKSVIPDMLKELNFRINGYLSKMGSNYSCEFDENFDATFTSSKGIETSYNNFSAGESMRLSIACCLAFKDFMQVRLDIHSNILMIDEYIDSNLDQMAVNEIMDFIHYMVGSEKIAALIISHRTEVKENSFDSEILVVKKNDESRLEISRTI